MRLEQGRLVRQAHSCRDCLTVAAASALCNGCRHVRGLHRVATNWRSLRWDAQVEKHSVSSLGDPMWVRATDREQWEAATRSFATAFGR